MRHKRKGDIFEEWGWASSPVLCPCPQSEQLGREELSSIVPVPTTEDKASL